MLKKNIPLFTSRIFSDKEIKAMINTKAIR